VQVYKLFTKHT